jgi:hypothetical protein
MSTTDRPQQVHADWNALQAKFKDFDLPDVYDEFKESAVNRNASNFVVKFGRDHARIAINLTGADFKLLLSGSDQECPVRWM